MRLGLGFACVLFACGGGSSRVGDEVGDEVGDRDVAAEVTDATAFDVEVAADVAPTPTCADVVLPSLRLSADGRVLRDALGRAVWLRGVNAGGRAKVPPFLPFAFDADSAGSLTTALANYVDRMRAWGLSVVRLPFTWEAVEPTRGVYDEVFLGRLDAYVAALGERGIRVVLDMHQDVFSRWYCGDGFPQWAMANPDRAPAKDCATWFLHYFQDADMQRDFDRFWSNADGLMDAYEAMWRMMAGRYGAASHVIGFEPINEPGWGTHDSLTFGRDVLTPFYTRMVAVLHEVLPTALVFVDPTGYDGVQVETSLTRPVGSGVVFAPHFYDALATAGGELSAAADIVEKLRLWDAVGADWNVPVFLGEFGLDHRVVGVETFLRGHWDAMDALKMHGTQWEYSVTGDGWNTEAMSVVESDGTERAVAAELVRVRPDAVAGEVTSFIYDAAARTGELALDGTGTSWLSAPTRLYPEGLAAMVVSGNACARWSEADGRLVVEAYGPTRLRFGPAAE